jgi:hypothetical protein
VSLRSRESARVDLERTSACYIVFPYVSNQTPATLKVSQPTSRPDSKCLLCRFDDVPIGPYVNTIDKELPKASNQMEEALQWNFIKQFVRNIGCAPFDRWEHLVDFRHGAPSICSLFGLYRNSELRFRSRRAESSSPKMIYTNTPTLTKSMSRCFEAERRPQAVTARGPISSFCSR